MILGCSQKEKPSISSEFKFLKSNFNSEVKIDFSKNELDLINEFEKQTQLDFCKSNNSLNAGINIDNDKLLFPLTVYKYCGWLGHSKNKISVLINKNNQVLIDSEFIIQPLDSLQTDLISATKTLMDSENKTEIVYVLNWDTKLDSTIVKNRILEILYATKSFSNELSMKSFEKEIDDLTENEFTELKKEFKPSIGIEQQTIIEIEKNVLQQCFKKNLK